MSIMTRLRRQLYTAQLVSSGWVRTLPHPPVGENQSTHEPRGPSWRQLGQKYEASSEVERYHG
eukprot:1693161-Pyramimonas_sp.AAC.1